ncbi:hypothetical protein AB1E18_016818 [Capra hircus]
MFPECPPYSSAGHLGPPPRRSSFPTPHPPEQNPGFSTQLRSPRPPSRRNPLHPFPEKSLASPHPPLSGAPLPGACLPPRPPRASSLRTPFQGSAPLRPAEGAPRRPTEQPSFRTPGDLSNLRILVLQDGVSGRPNFEFLTLCLAFKGSWTPQHRGHVDSPPPGSSSTSRCSSRGPHSRDLDILVLAPGGSPTAGMKDEKGNLGQARRV